MRANEIQHGGNHYQKREYQHWDFVCDTGLHYLLACASKYVTRWRDKNGLEDLRKSLHYIQKAIERNVSGLTDMEAYDYIERFAGQHDQLAASAISHIAWGEYYGAVDDINAMIEEAEKSAAN